MPSHLCWDGRDRRKMPGQRAEGKSTLCGCLTFEREPSFSGALRKQGHPVRTCLWRVKSECFLRIIGGLERHPTQLSRQREGKDLRGDIDGLVHISYF